jgi:hypothetical protein
MPSYKKMFASMKRAGLMLGLALASVASAWSQDGTISGTVKDKGGAGVAGVTVIAVNQVTSKTHREKSKNGGAFAFKLKAGAYRLTVAFPYVAHFPGDGTDPDAVRPEKAYAPEYPKPDDDKHRKMQDNVIVEGGKTTTITIPVEMSNANFSGDPDPKLNGRPQPAGAAGNPSVASAPQTQPDRKEVRDRWRVAFPEYDRYGDKGAQGRDIQFRRKVSWYNPYDQNVLKGDFPIIGQKTFFIFSAVSNSVVEQNRTPKPSDVSSSRGGSAEFFGQPELFLYNQVFQASFELFHGDSTFKPRDWAIKISPTFSLPNYADARENGVIHIDPRRGTNRRDTQFSLEDAFAEVKLLDTNSNYDFVSIRAGIQPFVSDFRGFIFSDNNLGFRTFGAFDNNRYQFNAAFFSQLEKDTNSGLNRFDKRRQNIYIANLFRQDCFEKGFTCLASFHYNDDRSDIEYDRNGFLVRPSFIGSVRPNRIKVGYLGFNTDGHIGRLNLTGSFYHAFGHETDNSIAGRRVDVRSNMAAVEASIDKDYLRYKLSFFWSQGDKNPADGKANGFDAIFDDPNFVGGQFSFWNRQGIRLTQTGVGLVQPFSVIPSLRSSKSQGQANFVNPGIFIYNAGIDVEVTQRIKTIFNVNYLRFHRTEPLEFVLFQPRIRHDIGFDYSVGVVYRPLLINNLQFTFGGALLQAGKGFRDIYRDVNNNCPPNLPDFCTSDGINIDATKPLYSLFGQVKFIF